MLQFRATGWINALDRGWIAITALPDDIDAEQVAGREVSIDGKMYLCRAVEMTKPLMDGYPVGLLIRGDR
jgi:hypothetical protein